MLKRLFKECLSARRSRSLFCRKVQILSIVAKPQTPAVALELIAPFEAARRERDGGKREGQPRQDRVTWEPRRISPLSKFISQFLAPARVQVYHRAGVCERPPWPRIAMPSSFVRLSRPGHGGSRRLAHQSPSVRQPSCSGRKAHPVGGHGVGQGSPNVLRSHDHALGSMCRQVVDHSEGEDALLVDLPFLPEPSDRNSWKIWGWR